jgi:hypothetical protein
LRPSGASIALFAVTLSVLAACGERFTGIDEPPDDQAGSDAGGADSGSAGKAPGGAGRGGKPSTAGTGGSGGAESVGGAINVGGSPSVGGVGGMEPEPPAIPDEGLELWLRADHGVVEVGEYVATWEDSSSKQRNATQSATNYRPKLVKDAMSGHSGVVFDGKDDYLRLPALDADFSAGVSIFAVALQQSAVECDAIFEASNGSEVDDLHLGDWKSAPIYEVGAPFLHAPEAPTVYGQPELLAAVHDKSRLVRLRRNSAGLAESMFDLPPLATRAETFIGRSLYAECGTWDGGIAEVLVYSRGVADEELVQIETYLQKKWGCCAE